jgi:PAS domain S-box-containing protein
MSAVYELLPDGATLLLRAGMGWKDGLVGHSTLPAASNSLTGAALTGEAEVITPDLTADAHFFEQPLLLDHAVVSGMSAAIHGKPRAYGALSVYSTRPRNFHPRDAHFLKEIASILASAIGRFRAEEELRFSRDQLAIILDGITEGMTLQNRQGTLIYANQAAAKVLGFDSPEELLNAPLPEVMRKYEILDDHGKPFPVERLPGRRVLQGALHATQRVRFRMVESGEEHWSLVDASPIFDASGEVIQAVSLFRDVTEQTLQAKRRLAREVEVRRKTEQALQESENMLDSLFESAPDAIILVNAEGNIARVNRQTEAMFGYTRAELIGESIDQLTPKRYRAKHYRLRGQYLQDMVMRAMGAGLQLFGLRKDNSEFPVDIMLSPVHTDDGEQVICAVRDMTDQKRLQSDLAEMQRRLFESVESERLQLSQELHDRPIQDLYGLGLYLETIKSVLQTPKELEELREAQKNVQKIVQTLRNICGELRPPALTHFGVERSIRSHLEKVRETHPELTIDTHLTHDGTLLPERTRLALYRVYQNAVSNVLRHAEAKHILVDLEIEEEAVRLQVQDDGHGFSVPDKWVNLVREGHFGLVGMRERVEAVGGRLEIDTGKGKGTTVRVVVPLENTTGPAAGPLSG